MAQVYQCDACGEVMKNPYDAKMKEFYVGCTFDLDRVWPTNWTRVKRIHLCEDCYHGLKKLAADKEE